jgi:hypothetical protein
MNRFLIVLGLLRLTAAPAPAQDIPAPAVDHHQHLFSPATRALSPTVKGVSADDLITVLDDAGIQRAAVLSIAYQYANPKLIHDSRTQSDRGAVGGGGQAAG